MSTEIAIVVCALMASLTAVTCTVAHAVGRQMARQNDDRRALREAYAVIDKITAHQAQIETYREELDRLASRVQEIEGRVI